MPVPSEDDVLVLLALRLTGLAEPLDVAARTGVEPATVDRILAEAADAGHVRYREGAFHGWALTPVGRRHVTDQLAAELDAASLRPALLDAYERFVPLNASLLQVCTEWQLRDGGGQPVVNDHTDPDYDEQCIEQLAELDAKAEPLVVDLGLSLARFGSYRPRLRDALARVHAGEGDWFTSPGVDSYHTVWFELHENLLATLGRERGTDEPVSTGGPS